MEEPGQDCPRCVLCNQRDGAIIQDRQEVVAGVEQWLAGQRPEPHPLEVELARLQAALEECPPLWWPERLLWRGVRWFYRMRRRRVRQALAGEIV